MDIDIEELFKDFQKELSEKQKIGLKLLEISEQITKALQKLK